MTMWCDPELVHSAIVDLLVNALEACEEKRYSASEVPEVILRAYCSGAGEEVVLEVEDNGEGMSIGTREKLFDPFFSTKRGTGTGIGLALVRRIARMHGGSVSVESEPCLGSTLRLSLPLRAQLDAKEELNAKESVGR
jgi:signal transduction histidine kinase